MDHGRWFGGMVWGLRVDKSCGKALCERSNEDAQESKVCVRGFVEYARICTSMDVVMINSEMHLLYSASKKNPNLS